MLFFLFLLVISLSPSLLPTRHLFCPPRSDNVPLGAQKGVGGSIRTALATLVLVLSEELVVSLLFFRTKRKKIGGVTN